MSKSSRDNNWSSPFEVNESSSAAAASSPSSSGVLSKSEMQAQIKRAEYLIQALERVHVDMHNSLIASNAPQYLGHENILAITEFLMDMEMKIKDLNADLRRKPEQCLSMLDTLQDELRLKVNALQKSQNDSKYLANMVRVFSKVFKEKPKPQQAHESSVSSEPSLSRYSLVSIASPKSQPIEQPEMSSSKNKRTAKVNPAPFKK